MGKCKQLKNECTAFRPKPGQKAKSSTAALTWLLSDPLGSTTETIAAGDVWTRPFNYTKLNWTMYKPWGQTRYTSGTTATNYLFTGQRSESSSMDGVYFFKARFYDSNIGRFLSADSIIPPNQGTQGYDRFAFVSNNPVNFNDPTGHKACSTDSTGPADCTDPETDWKVIQKIWGVRFEGDWTEQRKIWVLGAALAVGRQLADTIGGPAELAFQSVFAGNTPLIFLFGSSLKGYNLSGICSGIDSGGCTTNDTYNNTRIINFWDHSGQYGNGIKFMRNVVHELGHAFNSILSSSPANMLGKYYLGRTHGGYAGPLHEWQFNLTDSPSENFADMFVGWTYGQWGNDEYGSKRQSFMDGWMNAYLLVYFKWQ